jgi:hypothetical protein
MWALAVVIPILGTALAVAWPLARYASQERAHAVAIAFLEKSSAAQGAFRNRSGDAVYATSLESLIAPCSPAVAPIPVDPTGEVRAAGYAITLRAAAGATPGPPDCRGTTASDYYLALEPASPDAPGQRSFAMRGDGRIFVFFDGVAPREADMLSGGLAVPLAESAAFRIP